MRRWAKAMLAQLWEGFVTMGRLRAGETLVPPPRPAEVLPGHPERVPLPGESTPEDLVFWRQVAPLIAEAATPADTRDTTDTTDTHTRRHRR